MKTPPKHWKKSFLGKHFQIISGDPAPSDKSVFSGNGFPFIRMKTLGDAHQTISLSTANEFIEKSVADNLGMHLVEPDCILIPRSGSVYMNHRAILRKHAYIVGHIAALKKLDEKINLEYAYYYLCQIDLSPFSTRTTGLDSISFSQIQEIPFLVPPLEEQIRISSVVGSVDESISNSHQLISQLRLLKRATVKELFSKGLAREKHTFKKSILGQIPSKWRIEKIGTVAKVTNGTTPSKQEPSFWENGTVPWLPTGKVNDRIITFADAFITEKALHNCPLSLLPVGTSLIAMIGQGKTRGMTALLSIDACINQNFAAVIPGPELSSRFLFHFLDSKYDALRGSGRGSNQDALNCSIIKEFPMIVPPLPEQSVIADVIDSIDSRVSSEETNITQKELLKKSLLSEFLSGRVPPLRR